MLQFPPFSLIKVVASGYKFLRCCSTNTVFGSHNVGVGNQSRLKKLACILERLEESTSTGDSKSEVDQYLTDGREARTEKSYSCSHGSGCYGHPNFHSLF